MLRQRITGITYKTQTWKTDLLTTMCVTMEFCKQRMILTVLGIAGIQTETNFLGVEVCQSMGDLDTFKANEEKALQLAAQKCKQYGIVPSESTIMLHQEVYATACPHRSVEIHGGAAQTKAYFINRIKELVGGSQSASADQEGENEEMRCLFTVEGKGAVFYFDGYKVITLAHPDELKIVQQIYKDNNGKDMPCYKWSPSAPWYARLMAVLNRKDTTSI